MLPLVVRVEDVQSRRATTYTFQTSPVHVGRSELNDLALPQPFVSLWHAIFWFDDQRVTCADLGSTNGTQLDGTPLAKGARTELRTGGDLRIGTLKISFAREAPETASGAQPVRRHTVFGMRVGALPGSTMAIDRAALEGAREAGTSTAMTILHEGPLPFANPDRAGTPIQPHPGGVLAAHPPVTPLPPTPPRPPPPSEGVLQLVSHIAASYMDFRHAWRTLLERLRQGFSTLSEDDRAQAAALLQARFPALLQEEEYRSLVQHLPTNPGVHPAVHPVTPIPLIPTPAGDGSGATQLLTHFAQSYAPNARPFTQRGEVETFLDRLASLIETFSNAFLELRKGKDQFEKELGVPATGAKGPLQRARNVEEVLRYLVDTSDGQQRKPEELIRGFAEVMIHHVALLNGVREGAKGVLAQLSPAALSRPLRGEQRTPLQTFLDSLLPARARWHRFIERRQAMLEEESQLTAALFGPEFARAYTSVASDNLEMDPPKNGGA